MEIEIKQTFLTAPDGSLHFVTLAEEDFSPDFSTGLSKLALGLLQGAADVAAWSNSESVMTVYIICAGLRRLRELCGDALYDILISMTSRQLIRYPLFEGQGNFGWWLKDRKKWEVAASACFTTARLSPLGEYIAKSLDDKLFLFPFPALLVEGSKGYKENIPSHNLCEVIDACLAMIDKPLITLDEIFHYIQGPDFPVKGYKVISTASTLKKIYETGKGRIAFKDETGEKQFFKVNMCALTDRYKYSQFNLREYLQMFIDESRKNIVEFAKAKLAQLQEKETSARQEEITRYELLLSSQSEVDKLLRRQLVEIKDMFGDERRTKIKCRETRVSR